MIWCMKVYLSNFKLIAVVSMNGETTPVDCSVWKINKDKIRLKPLGHKLP